MYNIRVWGHILVCLCSQGVDGRVYRDPSWRCYGGYSLRGRRVWDQWRIFLIQEKFEIIFSAKTSQAVKVAPACMSVGAE